VGRSSAGPSALSSYAEGGESAAFFRREKILHDHSEKKTCLAPREEERLPAQTISSLPTEEEEGRFGSSAGNAFFPSIGG